MSSAEIGDNKWEVSASKPPVATAAGLLQLLMIGAFALIFGWITVNSVIGIVTPKRNDASEIEKQFTKDAPAAGPAAAP
ncbi:MAG: hypothetical protein IAG13_16420 [Deltaproteobacteria bacterium]|nr:hypothetical protein [Nannocystaceae bacterium]